MINDMIKIFLEKILRSKLTGFLNYDKYRVASKKSNNSRNGDYFYILQIKYNFIET
ncbi:hypothetical protein [Halanaerobium saccharolyticum]|uniref:hypothetical protein n=1 Tax=Halanaerobium saccharolyticum TaxID=43595 RepID=UPI0012675E62